MSSTGPVVVLAGGTGGAKLARGMLDVVGGDDLVVVANTGDDIEIYGAHVSPDPDLVAFWLADRIDERGWGLAGDTFAVMDGLRALGVDVWFNLGDRDLAIGLERARALDDGARLTEAHARICAALGIGARVLPMSDRPVRTRVMADGSWWSLQEFLIRRRGEGPVQDVDFRHVRAAAPTPEVARRHPRRSRDRHRPVQPRDLHRADPRPPGSRRGDHGQRRLRWSRSARSSRGESSRDRPRRSCAGPGARSRAPGSPRPTTG